MDYDSEDGTLNGYFHKRNEFEFNMVNRSRYGIGCAFRHENID